ncbi:luciferase family protein [Streptomyces sp. NPDC005820]|uniref:luciferase domain-containing protein n=1 Tax=Streptomyces sp. NPDC005820 TaxID=3157069 RepID=UPI00340D3F00
MTTAWHALAQLVSWPDLTEIRSSCGTGRALGSARGEIAHFHSDRSVDLLLTSRAIRHYERDLRRSTAIRLVPGSHWVTVRLECESDVSLLMTLMSAALRAHQDQPDALAASAARCNDRLEAALAHRETL